MAAGQQVRLQSSRGPLTLSLLPHVTAGSQAGLTGRATEEDALQHSDAPHATLGPGHRPLVRGDRRHIASAGAARCPGCCPPLRGETARSRGLGGEGHPGAGRPGPATFCLSPAGLGPSPCCPCAPSACPRPPSLLLSGSLSPSQASPVTPGTQMETQEPPAGSCSPQICPASSCSCPVPAPSPLGYSGWCPEWEDLGGAQGDGGVSRWGRNTHPGGSVPSSSAS